MRLEKVKAPPNQIIRCTNPIDHHNKYDVVEYVDTSLTTVNNTAKTERDDQKPIVHEKMATVVYTSLKSSREDKILERHGFGQRLFGRRLKGLLGGRRSQKVRR